jgi:proline dehydrogenase
VYQPTIDRWTLDAMRKHNRDGKAVLYNTYQAYLKANRGVAREHLEIAQKEGWIFGIKLVRGAYIVNDIRERIHDTKAETDASYNGIAQDLLVRSYDGLSGPNFPEVQVFLAGHNEDSIRRAAHLHNDLAQRGQNLSILEFGQLWGMADHVSGELVAMSEAMKRGDGLTEEEAALQRKPAPRAVRCINWGTIRECLTFLMRRAAENQGATERL